MIQDKYICFSEEIENIYNKELRVLAKDLINGLPDYFFEIPASSSGKYHPAYTLGEGGLIRHTKAAIKIAVSLLSLEQNKELKQYSDHIIIALLVHDGFKQGIEQQNRTVNDHPWLAANYVRNFDYKNKNDLSIIAALIESHMGEWHYGVLPKPQTEVQKFVHMCDYLASRKFLEVNFCED